MKNKCFIIGACLSLVGFFAIGAACVVTSGPGERLFGLGNQEKPDTTTNLKVEISKNSNNPNVTNAAWQEHPAKLQKGWPITLYSRNLVQPAEGTDYIFRIDASAESYFANYRSTTGSDSKIDGIKSITVDFDLDSRPEYVSDLKLTTSFQNNIEAYGRSRIDILQSGVPVTFDDYQPCFFKLNLQQRDGNYAGNIDVSRIVIEYSCKASPNPFAIHDQFEIGFDDNTKTATILDLKGDGIILNGGEITIPQFVCHPNDYRKLYTVTKLGNTLFANNTDLNTLTLPDTIQEIGDSCFENTKLLKCNTPKDLRIIGSSAFRHTNIINFDLKNVTRIEFAAFCDCSLLSKVDITNCTFLGDNAFRNSGINALTYSKYLDYVPSNAFESTEIKTLEIGDNVKVIKDAAFNSCAELVSIKGMNNVTSIDGYAFKSCKLLSDFVLPSKLETLGQYAFYDTNFTRMVIPTTLTTCGKYALGTNSKATLYIPFAENATPEGFDQFWKDYYSDFTTIYNTAASKIVDNNATYELIDEKVYLTEYFGYTKSYNIPNTIFIGGKERPIDGIKAGAFNSVESLKHLRIPSSTSIIEDGAFNSCGHFMIFVDFNFVINVNAFVNTPSYQIRRVYSESVIDINVPFDNPEMEGSTYTSIGSILLSVDFSEEFNSLMVKLPINITEVTSGTFADLKNTVRIIYGESVIEICKGAFNNFDGKFVSGQPIDKVILEDGWTANKAATFIYAGNEDFVTDKDIIYNYSYNQSEGITGTDGMTAVVVDEASNTYYNDIIISPNVMFNGSLRPVRVISGSLTRKPEAINSISLPNTLVKIGDGFLDGVDFRTPITFNGSKAEFDSIKMSDTLRKQFNDRIGYLKFTNN